MKLVGTGFSMALDGFIAGPNDDVEQVFAWYGSGDTDDVMPNGRMTVKVSPASAEVLRKLHQATGALVTGRRMLNMTKGWGGAHPRGVPVFVVTHSAPEAWPHEGSPFTFVTDGVESAITQARAAAGDKNVAVDGASIVQQALKAGLIDEIGVDLVPVLLGHGVRYFDRLGFEPVKLKRVGVVEAPGVTHVRFRVLERFPLRWEIPLSEASHLHSTRSRCPYSRWSPDMGGKASHVSGNCSKIESCEVRGHHGMEARTRPDSRLRRGPRQNFLH